MLERALRFFERYIIPKSIYRLGQSPYHFLLAFLGNLFYGFPSRRIRVVGVTGTKGKTTTLELIDAMLTASGKRTALLSSVRRKVGERDGKNSSENTMPGRFAIQRFLREAVDAGCEYALFEVTSEGVTKHRHRFIQWDAAVFLNLTPEHVEAHGSFENYREAKLDFFRYLRRSKKQKKYFVINSDDTHASYFKKVTEKVLRAEIILFNRDGVSRLMDSIKKDSNPNWLRADFNIENAAAARALTKLFGVKDETVRDALIKFKGLRGRMDFVQKEPFAAVVDYAHTPVSLRAVYRNLKEQPEFTKSSRLICVLGSCGGGRDKWKRPKIGEIAAHYCNEIILTNEDPYDEDPNQILREIKSGIPNSQQPHPAGEFPIPKVYVVLDRREAIEKAIFLARKGDVVVITGKGSEEWIHLAKRKKIPWDDRGTVEEILSKTQ
ncbi:MAG: UDP-N-acetylmuramyl-tripeptide synthetase [Patescibacteria group bacterium]|nr:UDP-N-acetylmuramyl-tripeptide synthetase [Patescibacteria group bacterium]